MDSHTVPATASGTWAGGCEAAPLSAGPPARGQGPEEDQALRAEVTPGWVTGGLCLDNTLHRGRAHAHHPAAAAASWPKPSGAAVTGSKAVPSQQQALGSASSMP